MKSGESKGDDKQILVTRDAGPVTIRGVGGGRPVVKVVVRVGEGGFEGQEGAVLGPSRQGLGIRGSGGVEEEEEE